MMSFSKKKRKKGGGGGGVGEDKRIREKARQEPDPSEPRELKEPPQFQALE
jgi:hypothetical protein